MCAQRETKAAAPTSKLRQHSLKALSLTLCTPVPDTLQEVSHAEIIRALKVEQAKELTKLRQEFELAARELGSKYEKKMKMLRDDVELRRKQEIHEIEEHKVGQRGAGCGWLAVRGMWKTW
jgi:vacuolar-type H+-ATPase subunit H